MLDKQEKYKYLEGYRPLFIRAYYEGNSDPQFAFDLLSEEDKMFFLFNGEELKLFKESCDQLCFTHKLAELLGATVRGKNV